MHLFFDSASFMQLKTRGKFRCFQDNRLPSKKQIRDSGSFFINRPMKNSLPKSSERTKTPYFCNPTS